MNILMITHNDPAGVAIAFTNAINRYTGHTCRLISTETRYNFNYQKDLHVPDFSGDEWDEVVHLLQDADMLHFHMLADEHMELGPVKIKDFIAGKKIIHHHHGHPLFRSNPAPFREKYSKLKRRCIVSTPDLLKLLPDAHWVPNPVPIHEPLYRPLQSHELEKEEELPVIIGQSPTRTDLKNTDELKKIVQELKDTVYSNKIELRILEWTPHERCLAAKRKCDIIFDHMQGYYGVSSLESLSQGKPVIAGLDPWNIRWIKTFTEGASLPWIIATTPEELKDQIENLVNSEELREHVGQKARIFMEDFWNEPRVLTALFRAYEEDIALKDPTPYTHAS